MTKASSFTNLPDPPGYDQIVQSGATVTLDGSGSADRDDPLPYAWSQTPDLDVPLFDTAAQSPTFEAPEDPARITAQLNVADGARWNTDSAVVDVEAPPSNPLAANAAVTGLVVAWCGWRALAWCDARGRVARYGVSAGSLFDSRRQAAGF